MLAGCPECQECQLICGFRNQKSEGILQCQHVNGVNDVSGVKGVNAGRVSRVSGMPAYLRVWEIIKVKEYCHASMSMVSMMSVVSKVSMLAGCRECQECQLICGFGNQKSELGILQRNGRRYHACQRLIMSYLHARIPRL